MKIRCLRARWSFPGVLDGGRPTGHVESCLSCQAEVARYRAMGRRLEELRRELVLAPAGLASAVIAGLDGPGTTSWRGRLVEGAAAAAGAALVVAWAVARWRRARAA